MKLKFQKLFNKLFRKNKRIDYGTGVYPPKNFTGVWEVFWPNGKLKFRSKYINGKEDGEYLCLWDNGEIAQKGQMVKGQSVGEWYDYWETGLLFKRTSYINSNYFQVFWYDPSGDVHKLQEYVDGKLKE